MNDTNPPTNDAPAASMAREPRSATGLRKRPRGPTDGEETESDPRSETAPQMDVLSGDGGLSLYLQETYIDEDSVLAEALAKAPYLLFEDTGLFMRFAKQDVRAASQRMERYWSQRRSIFGDSRAYLPMTQTGEGALTPSEVKSLRQGRQWFVLPATEQQREMVHLVCSFDVFTGSDVVDLRCLFYLLFVAMHNQAVQRDGLVLMIALPELGDDGNPRGMDPHATKNVHRFLDLLSEAMPIRLKSIHFVVVSDKPETADFLEFFSESLGALVPSRSKIHQGKSSEALLRILEAEGFDPGVIPSVLGGQWSETRTLEWHLQQAALESQQLEAKPASRHAVTDSSEQTCKETTTSSSTENSHDDTKSTGDDAASRKSFLRKRNAAYARRKYARRKIETEVFQDQVQELEDQNQRLRQEGERLESLVEQAQQIASLCDTLKSDPSQLESRPAPTQALELPRSDTQSVPWTELQQSSPPARHVDQQEYQQPGQVTGAASLVAILALISAASPQQAARADPIANNAGVSNALQQQQPPPAPGITPQLLHQLAAALGATERQTKIVASPTPVPPAPIQPPPAQPSSLSSPQLLELLLQLATRQGEPIVQEGAPGSAQPHQGDTTKRPP